MFVACAIHTQRGIEARQALARQREQWARAKAAQEAEKARRAEAERTRPERIRQWYAAANLEIMIEQRPPSARIIAEVARRHGVTPEDIIGTRRWRPLVIARHHAVYEVALRRPDLSLGQIGTIFGGRDHATVHNSISVWPDIARRMGIACDPMPPAVKGSGGRQREGRG